MDRIPWDHPHLLILFKLHCEEGLPPRSFAGKIYAGQKYYQILLKKNISFYMIHDFYQKKRPTSGLRSVYGRGSGVNRHKRPKFHSGGDLHNVSI